MNNPSSLKKKPIGITCYSAKSTGTSGYGTFIMFGFLTDALEIETNWFHKLPGNLKIKWTPKWCFFYRN